jgi:ABC-type lipoprotein export system ATPase subunit
MILEIRNLCKQYIRGKNHFYAVDHVNLQADIGDFICIVGHSGSGKSTLFNLAAGLLKPDDGSVSINGADIAGFSQKELSYLRNRKIGYIMQGQNLLPNFNIMDNICMPYYLSRQKRDLTRNGMELLEYAGLADVWNAYPSQLSGGELRRIAIARALLVSPDLILADEPTGNLDFDNAAKIMELFRKISAEETTVIVSTHDMEFFKHSTRAYRMTKGSLYEYA